MTATGKTTTRTTYEQLARVVTAAHPAVCTCASLLPPCFPRSRRCRCCRLASTLHFLHLVSEQVSFSSRIDVYTRARAPAASGKRSLADLAHVRLVASLRSFLDNLILCASDIPPATAHYAVSAIQSAVFPLDGATRQRNCRLPEKPPIVMQKVPRNLLSAGQPRLSAAPSAIM